MMKMFGLHPNKLEQKLEFQIPLLEDGLMKRRLNLLHQYQATDYIIMVQLLEHLERDIKKVIKDSPTAIVAYHQLNKLGILYAKNKVCNNNSLMLPLFQTLVAESIGKGPIFANWWLIPSMVKLKKLLLPTEIGFVDSVSNYWNKSFKCVQSNSWFSIKMSKNQPPTNWQKIYWQLYMYSIVGKWVREDIVQPFQNAIIKLNIKNQTKNQTKKPTKKPTKNQTKKPMKNPTKKPKEGHIKINKDGPLDIQKITIEKKITKRKYNKKPKPPPIEKAPIEKFNDIYNKENSTFRNKKIRIYPDKNQRQMLKKWIGTYRFTYNYTKDIIIKHKNKKNFQLLRDAIVTEKDNTLMNDKKWIFDTPKEIRANSIRELLSHLDSHNDVKYKSKKQPTQTINIPKKSYKKYDKYVYIYPGSELGKIKLINNHKINLDYVPDKIECDYKLTYSKPNLWYLILPIKQQIKVLDKTSHNICALDPNVRNLVTGAGIDGLCFKIGEGCYGEIKRRSELIDKLRSKIDRLKKSKNRLEYLRTKNVLNLQYFKIDNLINDLHNKAIKFITDRYDIILLPHLRTSELVKKDNKNFNKKIFSLRHYKFRMKLINKCKILGKKTITVTEEYTTKACSNCGRINPFMGEQEVFNCPYCKRSIDRDTNSAINILCKSLNK